MTHKIPEFSREYTENLHVLLGEAHDESNALAAERDVYKDHLEKVTVSLAYLLDAINCDDENATDWVDKAEREAVAILAKIPALKAKS